ncbi:Methionyl-tRNA synthetase [Aspergillus carlsbadensis]|nr:Methionyl-tRNA synthetase [Aspergillus carlsbadensis]
MADEAAKHTPILPEPGKWNILITSALPYVNNVPHLGNFIGSVLSADVFARYCRGRGINTLYVCTDEYGTTSETRALIEGCTPQELCDKCRPLHVALHQNGYLKEDTTTQLYCEQHSSFLADRFVKGKCPHCGYADEYGDQCDLCGQPVDPLELKNPQCKVDGATPVTRETKHIFLELDKLQPDIEQFFHQSAQEGAWSSNGKDITSACGGTSVPLPGNENKVIYAWFDACIGYVSITANYTNEWRKWWHNPQDAQLYQFLGKDNVAYHTVIFRGTQIGTQDTWAKLHHLSTTEYLTYEGGKFSKSRGIGVFGDSAQKAGVASDVWRYYLISHRPETSDTEFNWDAFVAANNNLLLKNLGNFVSRVIKFVNSKIYNNVVPDYTGYHETAFDEWKATINALLVKYIQKLDAVKLRGALSTVLSISQQGNIFLQSNGLDNKLAANEPLKCAAVIGLALNLIHLLGSVIAPFMPGTANSINAQLRSKPVLIPDPWSADSVKTGHEIGKAAYLFSNIKLERAQEWRKSFGGQEAQKLKEEEAARKAAKKAALKGGK